MYNGLLHLHNLLRWVILILLLVAMFQAFMKNAGIKKSTLFLMIAAHTTLVLGLYQWLAGRYGLFTAELPAGTTMMKDKYYRFFQMEHPVMMLIAVILITIARRKAKALNYKAVSILLLVTLIILAVTVPWPFRDTVGRPWFPGM